MKKVFVKLSGVLLLLMLSLQYAYAQTSISQAQAVFIYNFTRLTEWPSDFKKGDFVIGVYGSDESYNELKRFTSGKMVGNQPISVVRFSGLDNVKKCHILFIAFGKTKELPAIIGLLGDSKTLIITEKRGGLDAGAVINFVIVEDKLKFEIKVSNATKMGLKVHSNLENMAIAKY